MWIILVIFVGVFGVMFYACFAHRKSVGHKAAQFHENTTVELLWTVIPAIDPRRHRLAGDQGGYRAEGHLGSGRDHQGHRLPVEVGLRLSARRGRGHQLRVHARHAARADRGRRPRARTTCSRSTTSWWCRSARRSASLRPPPTSSMPGGSPLSAQSRTRFLVFCATHGFAPSRRARSAANAPSFAARSMGTCRSWSAR